MILKKTKILFLFPEANQYSGQTKAAYLIIDLFKDIGDYNLKILPIPTFNRLKNINERLKYFIDFLKFLKHLVNSFLLSFDTVYISLSQSWAKLIICSLPILYFSKIRKSKVVISLHGDNFVTWNKNSKNLKYFIYLLRKANIITILGERQKQKLSEFGFTNFKIVPNTVDVKELNEKEINAKHYRKNKQILFFSTLIDSKGFANYLKAIEQLSTCYKSNSLKAILCGPITFTGYCKDFKSYKDKESWIIDMIKKINKNGIRIEWIKGAYGVEKDKIFSETNIFVFPSYFPVESQPLVVLEAAATGCAIIANKIGELPNLFDKKEIKFLDSVSPENIVQNIIELLENDDFAYKLSINAFNTFKRNFSKNNYLNNWSDILK